MHQSKSNVLVLGATGVSGMNCAIQLSSRTDTHVFAFCRNANSAKKQFSKVLTEDGLKSVTFLEGQVQDDSPSYLSVIDTIDYVIYSAACRPSLKERYTNNEYHVGYIGLLTLLHFATKSKNLKKIIFISSVLVERPWHRRPFV